MSDEKGWAIVSMRETGGEYRIERTEYARVLGEWMRGAAFIDITTIDGSKVTVKGSLVEAVADMSPEAVESWRERNRREKRESEREL